MFNDSYDTDNYNAKLNDKFDIILKESIDDIVEHILTVISPMMNT